MLQSRIKEKEELYCIIFHDCRESILYNKTRASEFVKRLNEGGKESEIRIGYEPVF